MAPGSLADEILFLRLQCPDVSSLRNGCCQVGKARLNWEAGWLAYSCSLSLWLLRKHEFLRSLNLPAHSVMGYLLLLFIACERKPSVKRASGLPTAVFLSCFFSLSFVPPFLCNGCLITSSFTLQRMAHTDGFRLSSRLKKKRLRRKLEEADSCN